MLVNMEANKICNIGRRIRRVRKARGWSQEDLAHHAGTTQKTVSRIETSAPSVKLGTINAVLRALGMTICPDCTGCRDMAESVGGESGGGIKSTVGLRH